MCLSDDMFKNQIVVFFSSDWSRNNTYGLLSSDYSVAVIFQRDFGPEAVQKTAWCRRSEFFRGRVSFVLVEASTNFNYNFLKVECCSGEYVLVVLSAGFLKSTKVLECFRTVYKMKTEIYFLARLLDGPRSCS